MLAQMQAVLNRFKNCKNAIVTHGIEYKGYTVMINNVTGACIIVKGNKATHSNMYYFPTNSPLAMLLHTYYSHTARTHTN